MIAVWTEYDSAIFLLALTVVAGAIGDPRRRLRTALLGAAPLVSVAPWIPQIVHAQHAVGKTKLSPTFAGPSLTSLRDAFVTLALGEHGGTYSSAGRWLEFLLIVGLLAAAGFALATARNRTVAVIAAAAGLTLVGHAIATPLGVHVFNQRYLTIMIPLLAALGAAAIVAADRRWLLLAAAVLLSALGIVDVARRYNHQFEPDPGPVRAAAVALHPKTVLTDTPVILYYLGSLHPQLDRPFNLGAGRAPSCARPCLIIDDIRTRTGTPRQVTGPLTTIERRYMLTLER